MPFPWIIREKSQFSADFTVEKPALTQNNSRMTCLSADYTVNRFFKTVTIYKVLFAKNDIEKEVFCNSLF
jgi:hypothetical protein